MRNVTADTITQAFLDYCSDDTDERLKFVLERLANHLHDFVRETNLTHDEWRKGLELLFAAGEISTPERNEFILFSDVLGLSSLVDMVNSSPDGTPSSVLGPFHILGAPDAEVGADLKGDNEGTTAFSFISEECLFEYSVHVLLLFVKEGSLITISRDIGWVKDFCYILFPCLGHGSPFPVVPCTIILKRDKMGYVPFDTSFEFLK